MNKTHLLNWIMACPCFDAREEYAGLEEEVSRK